MSTWHVWLIDGSHPFSELIPLKEEVDRPGPWCRKHAMEGGGGAGGSLPTDRGL